MVSTTPSYPFKPAARSTAVVSRHRSQICPKPASQPVASTVCTGRTQAGRDNSSERTKVEPRPSSNGIVSRRMVSCTRRESHDSTSQDRNPSPSGIAHEHRRGRGVLSSRQVLTLRTREGRRIATAPSTVCSQRIRLRSPADSFGMSCAGAACQQGSQGLWVIATADDDPDGTQTNRGVFAFIESQGELQ